MSRRPKLASRYPAFVFPSSRTSAQNLLSIKSFVVFATWRKFMLVCQVLPRISYTQGQAGCSSSFYREAAEELNVLLKAVSEVTAIILRLYSSESEWKGGCDQHFTFKHKANCRKGRSCNTSGRLANSSAINKHFQFALSRLAV